MRITIDGARTKIATGRRCEPKKWLPQAGRLSGKKEETRSFNAYLDAVAHRIHEIHKDLVAAGALISGELMKTKYLAAAEHPRMLVEIYRYHNDQLATLVEKDFAPDTLKNFKTALAS